jgi:glutathione synthase
MKFVFIMDPLHTVKAQKDTTYYLMLGAQLRGHTVYATHQDQIFLQHEKVFANAEKVKVAADIKQPFPEITEELLALEDVDVVFVRPDPPFDRRYLYTTLCLDFLPDRVRVVNRPSSIRDWNEKLAALKFPEFTPKSLVSADKKSITKFIQSGFQKVVAKPLDGFGGRGIRFIEACNEFGSTIDEMTKDGQEKVLIQEYLESAKDGDKRVLLVDGEVIGGILRVHAEGSDINNLDAGGTAHPTELTKKEGEICQTLKPTLKKMGLFFVGIDFIGEKLMEINVTSPTGLQELCRFSQKDWHIEIIKKLEKPV